MKDFIRQRNIERYRQLLQSGGLDPDQRNTIEKLLAEEEAKLRGDNPPPDGARRKR